MKKNRFTEEQIAYALRLAEGGTPVADVCRQIAHDGSVSFIAYDARGRGTERATFAASYSSAATTRPAVANATKVISTKWHATFNLPTQFAEPNKTAANLDGNDRRHGLGNVHGGGHAVHAANGDLPFLTCL